MTTYTILKLNESEATPYVYEIRHIPSGQHYIGSRTISKNIDILNGYFTSSKIVKSLIKSDGITSFEVIGVLQCGSPEQAIQLEDFLLRSIPKEDRDRFINIAFNVTGNTLRTRKVKSIFNGSEYRLIGKSDEIPEGWIEKWAGKPPSRSGLRTYINPVSGDV